MSAGTIPKLPLSLLLLSLLSLSTASSLVKRIGPGPGANNNDEYSCVYSLFVRTGSIWKGGTDSKISVALLGSDGYGIQITDIEDWGGLMGSNYNYFERGNLDIFSGRGPCMSSPPCYMNLTSDGQGPHHGWYCNYLEVTATGPHAGCSQQEFTVEQWLATDTAPYQLYAARDYCSTDDQGSAHLTLSRRIKNRSHGHVRHVDA
ncbi:PLAT domain-containing protein 1 [Rhynchospora pubera]|uniref:PLAT domain-containing protein 1 n=1 Tax=Rhynchospora pubera TaxID=906938 RepID=A0AAV8HBG7_9POAL|nr:PLAT domain-containing protein 1 [Rhynchospora pubera]